MCVSVPSTVCRLRTVYRLSPPVNPVALRLAALGELARSEAADAIAKAKNNAGSRNGSVKRYRPTASYPSPRSLPSLDAATRRTAGTLGALELDVKETGQAYTLCARKEGARLYARNTSVVGRGNAATGTL